MNYIIIHIHSRRYVAASGSGSSYTHDIRMARVFDDYQSAENSIGHPHERIIPLMDELQPINGIRYPQEVTR